MNKPTRVLSFYSLIGSCRIKQHTDSSGDCHGYVGGILPNPVDIRFQKVSGLSLEISTQEVKSGGQNMFRQQLPNEVKHGNLVLERGQSFGVSPLNIELNVAFNFLTMMPSRVLIMQFSEKSIPVGAWMCENAFPVKWDMGELNAESKAINIEKLELAYNRMMVVRM